MTVGELENGRGTPMTSRELEYWKVLNEREARERERR